MNLRAKSKRQQWMIWGGIALAVLVGAAAWSFLTTGAVSFACLDPMSNHLALFLYAIIVSCGWMMRWEDVTQPKPPVKRRRKRRRRRRKRKVPAPAQVAVEGPEQREKDAVPATETPAAVPAQPEARPPVFQTHPPAPEASPLPQPPAKASEASPLPQPQAKAPETPPQPPPPKPGFRLFPNLQIEDSETGESLFEQARVLPHQEIPELEEDELYLTLLRRSAQKGYAPALKKFGEYAMRRSKWVEAYFWMSLAKRRGMDDLELTLRDIRRKWALGGYDDESDNHGVIFSQDAGSIGRALLHIDTDYRSYQAREYLKQYCPEVLDGEGASAQPDKAACDGGIFKITGETAAAPSAGATDRAAPGEKTKDT